MKEGEKKTTEEAISIPECFLPVRLAAAASSGGDADTEKRREKTPSSVGTSGRPHCARDAHRVAVWGTHGAEAGGVGARGGRRKKKGEGGKRRKKPLAALPPWAGQPLRSSR